MKYNNLHNWNLTSKEAIELQGRLREQVVTHDDFQDIKTIAGADIALEGDQGYAGVIVYSYPELREIERRWAALKIEFPYIPGLLAFREGPILLKAFEKIENEPDLIIFDGQGIAHPRGVGIASHMGLILDRPTIGCAKSLLFGRYEEPGPKAGEWTQITVARRSSLVVRSPTPSLPHLMGEGEGSHQIIGACLRTRDNVNPIFVSIGHRISLKTAIGVIMNCADGYRIPRPTREADHFVGEVKRDRRFKIASTQRLC